MMWLNKQGGVMWLPAWVWVTSAAAVAFAALVMFGRGWWRVRWVLDWAQALSVPRWWYSWRRARHVLAAECDWCGPGVRCTCRREADPDFYGSMTLAGERALYWPAPPRHEVTHEGSPDWREQTAADLAPEALANDTGPDPYLDALAAEYGSEFDDPGPGDLPSLDPGPDCPCGKPINHMEFCYDSAPEPSRLADTADVMDAHLLADVEAFMRAQDDEARAAGSARALGWAGFMRDLEASLA